MCVCVCVCVCVRAYALCNARTLPPSAPVQTQHAAVMPLCVTTQELNDKYSVDVQQHIETVQDCGGRVIHGVDGTKLQECKALRGQRYHKIVFQFPHVGE